MTLLWTVVGVLAVGTVLNLLLTLALVRRLRTGGQVGAAPLPAASTMPEHGLLVGEFAVPTLTGAVYTADSLGSDALVAFLSPHCSSCRTAAAMLTARVAELPSVRLVLVVGDPDGAQDRAFADELAEIADVAFVDPFGPAGDAFGGIAELPVLVRVHDGFVAAASTQVGDIIDAVPIPVGHGA